MRFHFTTLGWRSRRRSMKCGEISRRPGRHQPAKFKNEKWQHAGKVEKTSDWSGVCFYVLVYDGVMIPIWKLNLHRNRPTRQLDRRNRPTRGARLATSARIHHFFLFVRWIANASVNTCPGLFRSWSDCLSICLCTMDMVPICSHSASSLRFNEIPSFLIDRHVPRLISMIFHLLDGSSKTSLLKCHLIWLTVICVR